MPSIYLETKNVENERTKKWFHLQSMIAKLSYRIDLTKAFELVLTRKYNSLSVFNCVESLKLLSEFATKKFFFLREYKSSCVCVCRLHISPINA